MEPSDLSLSRPSPRRELQGPRPTPLQVRKDSHKIRKPPAAAPPQTRQPVIIYTVSPKVIHASRSEFMSLVQRLTGAASSSADPTAAASRSRGDSARGAPLSPAARLAVFERTSHPASNRDVLDQLEIDGPMTSSRAGLFPGILSPVPSSLPPVSPNLFSASTVPSELNLFNELSPAFHGGKSYVENPFLPSPNNFLSTPILPSPGAFWDLFNQNEEC
ncbi:protein MKS1-like [Musa acuminata AAA Group]|uniref:protein MKS1-like n=1 Tax=Musa acuminata AAA Group TaxID=214697 RepID=UPI0031D2021B